MADIFDMIAEDEAKALEATRKEIAAEDAAWNALTDKQQDAVNEARAERWRQMELDAAEDDFAPRCEYEDEDEDEDDGEE